MYSIYKKCLLLIASYLAINQVQAQVTPASTPVQRVTTERVSPRPLPPIVSTPNRPGQQVMPQQRDYAWYANRLQRRDGTKLPASRLAGKPTAIANPAQMPASRSMDWYRQNLMKRHPHLQQPAAARLAPAGNAVMPAQRSYEWYRQQLNAGRQRTHFTTMPGNRN